jgi:predicted molibdopterin-dependent oxidoreductase YjgC
MAAPAEEDGTWTNCERRVQRIKQVIPATGDAKPAWRIFSECLVRATGETPMFNAREVLAAISKEHGAFAAVDGQSLDGEGAVLRG